MLAVSQIISKEGEACFLHLSNPSLNTKGHLTSQTSLRGHSQTETLTLVHCGRGTLSLITSLLHTISSCEDTEKTLFFLPHFLVSLNPSTGLHWTCCLAHCIPTPACSHAITSPYIHPGISTGIIHNFLQSTTTTNSTSKPRPSASQPIRRQDRG